MLSPRPSSFVAPSIWKLEVETPQMKPGRRLAVFGSCVVGMDDLLGPAWSCSSATGMLLRGQPLISGTLSHCDIGSHAGSEWY
ncbi:hypothetical protein BDS110ZK25_58870 [Bradyrhizobium diazoefficiens]|uniref:Uncharacterized protein n=1 Tax=Bradyrhizobium diazoefficiens TaxID=1355477 RepID=A0A810A476_9BRAD|nr:hypothetical protein H12S4_53780 [Bradyrhizobium diazoefficiens]BCA21831.1 hypothetical protein BDHH15_50460 [Bradyrhizobium diazoefficiens]BCE57458.1 hypothetical protein XF5B_49700 [Bradyrhizobium diazoefficiens]BCE66133.1 hypothetical protein XF6B_49320 [Bradyrhizobium diazoefficiens]BCF00910.1 hypothetical protein XF11B_49300 [Bradyrhizobium diazoefficiens]